MKTLLKICWVLFLIGPVICVVGSILFFILGCSGGGSSAASGCFLGLNWIGDIPTYAFMFGIVASPLSAILITILLIIRARLERNLNNKQVRGNNKSS